MSEALETKQCHEVPASWSLCAVKNVKLKPVEDREWRVEGEKRSSALEKVFREVASESGPKLSEEWSHTSIWMRSILGGEHSMSPLLQVLKLKLWMSWNQTFIGPRKDLRIYSTK